MTKQQLNPVLITEEDYRLLKPYMDRLPGRQEEMTLAYELGRAVIVKKDAFPPHAIAINSKVAVLDLGTNRVLEFTLVMPDQADMRQHKVSITTPMGAALIGFRKGEELQWRVPAGLRRFRILEVENGPGQEKPS
ncbi:MAG: transcription elongation factor GreAB [Sphingobacteriales bacterium]|nr:MAG: transcription elongation factor GreAB [Sphingobacteriales bacterium]